MQDPTFCPFQPHTFVQQQLSADVQVRLWPVTLWHYRPLCDIKSHRQQVPCCKPVAQQQCRLTSGFVTSSIFKYMVQVTT